MVTCYLKYIIDASKLAEFEHYAKLWIPLVAKFGGQHHGYFLPHEGASNVDWRCSVSRRSPSMNSIAKRPAMMPRCRLQWPIMRKHAAS